MAHPLGNASHSRPAMAGGIQSVDTAFPEVCGVDSRFRGNDCDFERPCLANDTGTLLWVKLTTSSLRLGSLPISGGQENQQKQMGWVIWNVSDQEQTTLEQRGERRQREAGRRKPFGPPLDEW